MFAASEKLTSLKKYFAHKALLKKDLGELLVEIFQFNHF